MIIFNTKGAGLVLVLLMTYACDSDTLPEPMPGVCETLQPTYEDGIKDLVDTNCSYSGCHISGFAHGDFSTYLGMQSHLENGKVKEQVIDLLEMPPYYAPTGAPYRIDGRRIRIV